MRCNGKKESYSFGLNLLKCSWRQAGTITSCSAGRSGGSSGGEPCLDDNGAGHGEPRLETFGEPSGGGESVDLECENQSGGEPSGEQPKIGQSGCGQG